MKRLLMALAIVAAASLASAGVQPASANPAHHPAQATKGKKASPTKKTKKVKTGMSMQCPMMKGHAKKHGMMMRHGRMMKCPMMSSAKHHNMGMTRH